MAKPRDTKAEYARRKARAAERGQTVYSQRVKSGESRGLSKSQAGGHAKKGEWSAVKIRREAARSGLSESAAGRWSKEGRKGRGSRFYSVSAGQILDTSSDRDARQFVIATQRAGLVFATVIGTRQSNRGIVLNDVPPAVLLEGPSVFARIEDLAGSSVYTRGSDFTLDDSPVVRAHFYTDNPI